MSQAIQEMEQFSDAEGANENDGADGGGEDENGDSAEEYWSKLIEILLILYQYAW